MNEAARLKTKKCTPCKGNEEPLDGDREDELHSAVNQWTLDRVDTHKLYRNFMFEDFEEALEFVNEIGDLAEDEGHHPNILIHDYKHVRITLWTHAIDGLSQNDFIMAVKTDNIWDDSYSS